MDNEMIDVQGNEGIDTNKAGIGIGIFGILTSICMFIKMKRTENNLKKEREKNVVIFQKNSLRHRDNTAGAVWSYRILFHNAPRFLSCFKGQRA